MTADGRRDPRRPTVLKIRFKSATITEFVEKHSRDISRGGIFIKMKAPFPPGTLIKFDIQVAEGSMIHGVGRVVWTRTREKIEDPAGMGVKFIKIEDNSRPVLEAILTEKSALPTEDRDESRFDGPIPSAQLISKAPPPSASRKPKRTMIGMGLPPGGLKVPKPTKSQVTEAPREEAATPPPPVPSTARESKEEAPAPNFDLLAGSSEEFVADISSALDNALDEAETVVTPFAEIPAMDGKDEGKRDKGSDKTPADEAPNDTAPEGKEVPIDEEPLEEALYDDIPIEETPVESSEMPEEEPPPVDIVDLSLNREPSKRRGISPVLWIVLAIFAAGGASIWLLRDKIIPEEQPTPPLKVSAVTRSAPPTSKAPEATEPPPTEPAADVPLSVVKVATKPTGATIEVNGERQDGVTPLVLNVPTGKEVTIKASLFGYQSKSKTITPIEKPGKLPFDLKKRPLRMTFLSEPKKAQILIDRKKYGFTPRIMVTRAFEPEFDLVIETAGYKPLSRRITLQDWTEKDDGYVLEVEAVLEEQSESEGAPETGPKPAATPPPKKEVSEVKPEPKPEPEVKPKSKIEDNPF